MIRSRFAGALASALLALAALLGAGAADALAGPLGSALADERIAANQAAGEPLFLIRAHHRKAHLDEVERVLR